MEYLSNDNQFPDVSLANSEGLLAIGGNLSAKRLITAYQNGIFPWFDDEQPILWWSPDPRFVLFPDKLIITKTMRKVMRNHPFEITFNKAFSKVILECALAKRKGQSGTWITSKMIEAYCELNALGFAKSVEVWHNEELVGGLYGVDLGNQVFCGESMFSKVNNASKVGFITFIQNSDYKLIDCQVYTKHLKSLGAENIARAEFIEYLN